MSDDEYLKSRITELEQEIESIKSVLGAFAVGLDKVSQVQANQTGVIEGLVQTSELQAQYMQKLVENTEKHNELLNLLLERKND